MDEHAITPQQQLKTVATLLSSLSLAQGQTFACGCQPDCWAPLSFPYLGLHQQPLTAFPQHPHLFGVDLCSGRKAVKVLSLIQKERGLLCAHGHFRKLGQGQ